jgi:hypothetical protein
MMMMKTAIIPTTNRQSGATGLIEVRPAASITTLLELRLRAT